MVLVITSIPGMALALLLAILYVTITQIFIWIKVYLGKSTMPLDMPCSEEDFKRFKRDIMMDPSLTEISIPHTLTHFHGCLASKTENGGTILSLTAKWLNAHGWDYIISVTNQKCQYCLNPYPTEIKLV